MYMCIRQQKIVLATFICSKHKNNRFCALVVFLNAAMWLFSTLSTCHMVALDVVNCVGYCRNHCSGWLSLQISTNVILTRVRMVVPVMMVLMATRATVRWDTMVTTVKLVNALVHLVYQTSCAPVYYAIVNVTGCLPFHSLCRVYINSVYDTWLKSLTDIDECDGVTCNGQGTCEDLIGDYYCNCTSGWGGNDCDTGECDMTSRDIMPNQL